MNNEYKEQNIPLVNVSGILLGACALGYDSAYCMYRLYLSSGFSAGKTNDVFHVHCREMQVQVHVQYNQIYHLQICN